jgi:hypothetical protein
VEKESEAKEPELVKYLAEVRKMERHFRGFTVEHLLKDRIGDQRGGSEWEPIKILSRKNSAYIPIATPRVTHEQAEAHTNLSRYLRNKA